MTHIMRLEKTYESGNEVYVCDECGRRLMITWNPEFIKTVIESGNDNIPHSGGKGGLTMNLKMKGNSYEN